MQSVLDRLRINNSLDQKVVVQTCIGRGTESLRNTRSGLSNREVLVDNAQTFIVEDYDKGIGRKVDVGWSAILYYTKHPEDEA